MANLLVSSQNWGGVFNSESNPQFPCMDTNYRELTWTFHVLKQFATFQDLIDFEQDMIPTYFSTRQKTVVYASETEENCYLQSFKRKELITPTDAVYEIIFTKEG